MLDYNPTPNFQKKSNILEYTCVNKKTREKGSFFVVECVKQGMCAGSKMPCFSEKKGGFVKICSNSFDSNLFRGSNLRQNPTKSLFRG